MQRKHRAPTGRRGASAVEFAICAPIAFALIFAVIEYSRAMQLEHTLRLAAFEGARAGVTLDSSTSDVQNRVQGVLQAVRIPNAQVSVSPNPLSYTSPTVTVTVTADATTNGWVTWFIPRGTAIQSTITLNREVLAVSSFGVSGGVSGSSGSTTSGSGSSSTSGSSTTTSTSGSTSSTSGSSSSGTTSSGTSGTTSSGTTTSGTGSSGSSSGWGGGWW